MKKSKKPKLEAFVQFGTDREGRWWWVSSSGMSPTAQRIGPFHGPFATEAEAREHFEATKFPDRRIEEGGEWDPEWDPKR